MTDDPTTEDRQYAARLFATARRTGSSRPGSGLFSDPAELDQPIEPTTPSDNRVPREGTTSPGSVAHDDSHEFVRNLFSH